ncbi:perakine reductase isoform X2 [Ricinus communis]|uniref:perakine reductase isoform X2 n=1 Tax=Ricinus communis TaxID=3988 RepID=UPI00201B1A5F|nr:perakine reductase isoform X2 [Ricinus communis]
MEKQNLQLPKVKLGNQGLQVSRLGLGCAGLSGLLNAPLSHEDGCSLIKEAFNRGVTFIDTADIYGFHDNEIMVGKALKQLPREKVQLATKFGFFTLEDGQFQVKGDPEYVRKCCEASLKRLDVDYIDLYYQHRVDTSVPIEDTVGELKKLVNEGKIKYIGLSEASADTIRRAHAVHPITALQMEYSLWTRDIEDEVFPLCRELGIGIVAYSPLGVGFFAGKAVVESLPNESFLAQAHPRFKEENVEKNKVLYVRLANLATKHGCTPPQLALAWLLYQGDDIVPIPGTTKVKNLDNNIGSLAVKLTKEDLEEISSSVQANEVSGSREVPLIAKYTWRLANTPPKSAMKEEKIKYIGLSEASVDTIRRAHAVHPITAVEMEYSLWARDIEEDIIPICRELGIGIVAYSPLGRGFLAGKAVVENLPEKSLLFIHPRFTGENLEKNKLSYARLADLAAKRACTPAQLALAWVLHQGEDIVPIPGTTKLKNLENNIGSLTVKLTEEDLKEISDAVPINEVGGRREYDMFANYVYKLANTPYK